jgi:hypothetical protein
MSQAITLELRDELYSALRQQSEKLGLPLSDWIAIALEQHTGLLPSPRSEAEQEEARQRFRRHARAIDLGYPTGADNDSIDADLLKAYTRELA